MRTPALFIKSLRSFEQPLADSLNIHDLLWRVCGQDQRPVFRERDFVLKDSRVLCERMAEAPTRTRPTSILIPWP